MEIRLEKKNPQKMMPLKIQKDRTNLKHNMNSIYTFKQDYFGKHVSFGKKLVKWNILILNKDD